MAELIKIEFHGCQDGRKFTVHSFFGVDKKICKETLFKKIIAKIQETLKDAKPNPYHEKLFKRVQGHFESGKCENISIVMGDMIAIIPPPPEITPFQAFAMASSIRDLSKVMEGEYNGQNS
jgi:hypothetical protein